MEIPQGTGTGFLWDDKGHIVTNFHVIYEADEIEVKMQDGKSYDASIVGADPDHDLAVLQINTMNLNIPPVMIGISNDLRVGQKVLAIGNPFRIGFHIDHRHYQRSGQDNPVYDQEIHS